MYSEKDWIRAITALMQKTSDGELEWEEVDLDRDDLPNVDHKPGRAYQAVSKKRLYKVFTYQEQQFSGEYETFYWRQRCSFQIFDDVEGTLLGESPDLSIISDLLETVQRRRAFASGALDGLI